MTQPRPTSQISKNQTCKIVLDCPMGTLIDLVDERDCPLPDKTCHVAIPDQPAQSIKTDSNGRVVLTDRMLKAGQNCVVSFPELDAVHLRTDTSPTPTTAVGKGYECRSGKHYRFRYNTRTKVYMGLFFDGTGNNIYADEELRRMSNVACLYQVFDLDDSRNQKAHYINGVGTQLESTKCSFLSPLDCLEALRDTALAGGGFAAGMRNRLHFMLQEVEDTLKSFHNIKLLEIALFGFSRGAVAARIFCNWINEYSSKWKNQHTGLDVKIRFLGIFDSVSSIGIAGNNIDIGFNKDVPPNVETVVHFIAAHERRGFFPLQSIRKNSSANLPANWFEIAYPGVHSDVGGGYELDQQHEGSQGRLPRLASIPLKHMHKAALQHQVPLLPVSKIQPGQSAKEYYETSRTMDNLYGAYNSIMAPEGDLANTLEKHDRWYFHCLSNTNESVPSHFDKGSRKSVQQHWDMDFKWHKQGYRLAPNADGKLTKHPVHTPPDTRQRVNWIEEALALRRSRSNNSPNNLNNFWEFYIHDSVADYRAVDSYLQARRIYYHGHSRWIREDET